MRQRLPLRQAAALQKVRRVPGVKHATCLIPAWNGYRKVPLGADAEVLDDSSGHVQASPTQTTAVPIRKVDSGDTTVVHYRNDSSSTVPIPTGRTTNGKTHFRKARVGSRRFGTSAGSEQIGNTLHAFDTLLHKMRSHKSAFMPAASVEDLKVAHLLEPMKLGRGPQASLAATLQSAYPDEPFAQVERELSSALQFVRKTKRAKLSTEVETIFDKLGLGEALAVERSSRLPTLSSPHEDGPLLPTEQSFVLETPKDLLTMSPQTAHAKSDQRSIPYAAKSSKPTTGEGSESNPAGRKSPTDFINKELVAVLGGNIRKANAADHPLTPLPVKTAPVPELRHDLSRVLFNPGVYELQDPRSRVWNFNPYLGNLMPVSDFNYDALSKYITSSEDVVLRDVAVEHDKRYIGSTSSMSGALAHFHFLLSNFRPLNLDQMSRSFEDSGTGFTKIQKAPSAIFLRYNDGVYAIDADKEHDSANVLMMLGRSMEKLLTSEKEEFERYRKPQDGAKAEQVGENQPEAYHYSSLGQFLLRSQLDAHDPRLPGTGTFDLKTRAVSAVRMMMADHEMGAGYQIKTRIGTWESYEREYYDMMRSTFLKYSLQVRMGRMDGIFVAYHNTQRMFGFQYVPLPDMDLALHGQSDTTLGDQEFALSIQILNEMLNEATMKYPARSLRLHFEAREPTSASPQHMMVFVEPIAEEEIVAIQNTNKADIRAWEERILNAPRSQVNGASSENSISQASEGGGVDSPIDPASEPINSTRSNAADVAFIDSILGMDLDAAMTPKLEGKTESPQEKIVAEERNPEEQPEVVPSTVKEKEVLAWKVQVRNVVNGQSVVRPSDLKARDKWTVQYTMEPLEAAAARRGYLQCKNRRKSALNFSGEFDYAASPYHNNLIKLSKDGTRWRRYVDELDTQREQVLLYEK